MGRSLPSALLFRWIENMRMHFAVMCDRSARTRNIFNNVNFICKHCESKSRASVRSKQPLRQNRAREGSRAVGRGSLIDTEMLRQVAGDGPIASPLQRIASCWKLENSVETMDLSPYGVGYRVLDKTRSWAVPGGNSGLELSRVASRCTGEESSLRVPSDKRI